MGEGVRIVEDILTAYGIDTLEGRVGPLLFGETGRTHFLDMPAGSYVDEHPHDDEAFTLTVRGSYVLCVDGVRRLMKPGSIHNCHFCAVVIGIHRNNWLIKYIY